MHKKNCVETPQHNGRVERKHQQILNTARVLKFQSGMDIKYWRDYVLIAIYLINKAPSSVLGGKTSFEVLHKKKPNYCHLKVFGFLAFAYILMSERQKFNAKTRRCVSLRYSFGTKGYKLLDEKTGEVIISKNVISHERVFLYKNILVNELESNTFVQDNTRDQTIGQDSLDIKVRNPTQIEKISSSQERIDGEGERREEYVIRFKGTLTTWSSLIQKFAVVVLFPYQEHSHTVNLREDTRSTYLL